MPSSAESRLHSRHWPGVLTKGEDIVPIPGTKRRGYLEENVAGAEVELSDEDIARLDEAVSSQAVTGGRYAERDMTLLNH